MGNDDSRRRLRRVVMCMVPIFVLGALALWAVCHRGADPENTPVGNGFYSPVPPVSGLLSEAGETATPSGTGESEAATPSGTGEGEAASPSGTDEGEAVTPSGTDKGEAASPSGTDEGEAASPSGTDEGEAVSPSGTDEGEAVTPSGTGEGEAASPSGTAQGDRTGTDSGNAAGEGFSDNVRSILAGMTLREKACQMMLVTPSSITGVSKVTSAGDKTRAALEKYPVGGLDYNKTNMVSKQQVSEMLANTQSYSKIPLILTCNEEGGRAARLMNTIGTTWVDAMLDYKDDGPETARANAYTIAQDMSALGFNMDLAPVADVWSNPKNTVIGDRAYSDDFDQAVSLLPAAVEGFQAGGVACVVKHFPGHGDSSDDSHYGSVYIYKTLDELRAQELRPFQAAIDAGADSVMMGHLIVKDVDEEPAVFSYDIVTKLLREEMGFDGVVMTDALAMKAISDHYSSAEVAVKSVKAGVDMLLCPMDLDDAIEAIVSAVESGEIDESRIDESVLRILRLKENRGIL